MEAIEDTEVLLVDKTLMKRILIIAVVSIVTFWSLNNYAIVYQALTWVISILSPLIMGAAIAFILNVPMRALEKRVFTKGRPGVRRVLSLVTTFVLLIAVVVVILLIVIPEVSDATDELSSQIPGFIDRLKETADSLTERFPALGSWLDGLDISWDALKDKVLDLLQISSDTLGESTVRLVASVVSSVVNFVLGIVFACYMLAQKERLARQFKRCAFAYLKNGHAEKLMHFGAVVDSTFSRFLRGVCTEAVILGLMFLVSMLAFRFPYAVLVSALVSVCAFIPIVGAFIAAIVGMLLMLVSDPIQALWFLVLFLVLQQIEGNLIYPRVVGDSIGLPALWVLAAVMIGGKLFGVFGMLVSVPLAAVVYVLLRESVEKRLKKREVRAVGGD